MNYIVITGPTACGKTRRAVELARHLNGEIISADSRQVYRGMDLGTGKDIEEYEEIPYHLIDIQPAGATYDLFQFLRDEQQARADILGRGRQPILCGGTGLYVESVVAGRQLPPVPANPELRSKLEGKPLSELTEILCSITTPHNTTDLLSARRAIRAIEIAKYRREHPDETSPEGPSTPPSPTPLVIGMEIDRDSRRRRISERLRARIEAGMIDEVKVLLEAGVPADALIGYGLEYRFITLHLLGELSESEMARQLEIAIHQFAKRQMTWFRGMERRGHHIHWLPYDLSTQEFLEAVDNLTSGATAPTST